jgi:uncharacterized protein (TIGR01777 family)
MSETGPVLVSGATGLVGGRLVARLRNQGSQINTLSRRRRDPLERTEGGETAYLWDGVTPPDEAIATCASVVHLAGEPVFGGLPTAARRQRIRDSRVDSTTAFVRAIANLPEADRPRTFVCASAVGIYGDRGDEQLDESSAIGEGFLAEVCRDWENAAARAEESGVRVVRLRIGIVLAREGGALKQLALPFKLGLGGRIGDGRQWMPWIHIDDLVALTTTVIADETVHGPVNATAPELCRNVDFTRAIGRVLRRPTPLPIPAIAVRTALGEFAGELLGSRRVIPARAQALGFEFRSPGLEDALDRELRSIKPAT